MKFFSSCDIWFYGFLILRFLVKLFLLNLIVSFRRSLGYHSWLCWPSSIFAALSGFEYFLWIKVLCNGAGTSSLFKNWTSPHNAQRIILLFVYIQHNFNRRVIAKHLCYGGYVRGNTKLERLSISQLGTSYSRLELSWVCGVPRRRGVECIEMENYLHVIVHFLCFVYPQVTFSGRCLRCNILHYN